jgi:hypothetical protein
MKKIPLTQGKFTLVDDEDYEELSKYKWFAMKKVLRKGLVFYAARNAPANSVSHERGLLWMHRVIMNTPDGFDTDHINGDRLDNRRENLRICTHIENMQNQGKRENNTSGYKGVTFHKREKKWRAQVQMQGKRKTVGSYTSKEEAYLAYCEAAKKYHGDFANAK